MFRSHSFAVSAALGAFLGALAFVAGSGNEIESTAIVEVAIVLGSGVALAYGVMRMRRGPVHGGGAVLLFAILAVLTALSMSWSLAPDATLEETARTFAYLGIFAAAVMAGRLAPGATPAVLGGILIATVMVAGWALLTRVFPSDLGGLVLAARLSEPFGYWNALGAMAALGIPAVLWLGSRRDGGPRLTALAYPALGVLLLTVLLTQSRGALAAGAIGVVLFLALVPLRLRAVTVLALPSIAVAPVAAWALSKDAFTKSLQPDSAREAVAGDFGLMLLAMTFFLFAAGLAIETVATRRAPSLRVRRGAGVALVAVACLVPLAGLTSVAMSDRGLTGTISDQVEDVTDERAPPPGAARLGSVSSSRGGQWRQAISVFEERPSVGRGAGAFGIASLRHRKSFIGSVHAHGFFAQTGADLGVVGLALTLALLAAWLAAASRATGFIPRTRPRPEWDGERIAIVALALCVVVFGAHSFIDWTWFIPAPTAAALLAAGFVAGRGPLGAGPPEDRPVPGTVRRFAAAAIMLTALLCAWAAWQPERAARANERAAELMEQGDTAGALRQADRARDIDPYSVDPLNTRAEVLNRAGRRTAAYRALEQAVIEHPRDSDTWLRLGRYELEVLDLPARALQSAEGALRAEPNSRKAMRLRDEAAAAIS